MAVNGGVFDRLKRFIKAVFKTTVEIFLDALKLSPNAQGYIAGSITELLLKKKLEEEHGWEVKRIREKWEGQKHPNHHGDFYFRIRPNEPWYVIECKGVKSNAEKWHKLYNYTSLKKFLTLHSDKVPWIIEGSCAEEQVERWIVDYLPKFQGEYSDSLYSYEEVQRYLHNPPKRQTKKYKYMRKLEGLKRDEVDQLIVERLKYVMEKVMLLDTHFVAGVSGASERTQATPRVDEFNVVAVDIFLRWTEHKFLFANPKLLEPSGTNPNHLQQNYVMGFVFPGENGQSKLHTTEEWYEDLNDVYKTLNRQDCVSESDMQEDIRQEITYDDLVLDDEG